MSFMLQEPPPATRAARAGMKMRSWGEQHRAIGTGHG